MTTPLLELCRSQKFSLIKNSGRWRELIWSSVPADAQIIKDFITTCHHLNLYNKSRFSCINQIVYKQKLDLQNYSVIPYLFHFSSYFSGCYQGLLITQVWLRSQPNQKVGSFSISYSLTFKPKGVSAPRLWSPIVRSWLTGPGCYYFAGWV